MRNGVIVLEALFTVVLYSGGASRFAAVQLSRK